MRYAYWLSGGLVAIVAGLLLGWIVSGQGSLVPTWHDDGARPLRIGYALEAPFVTLDAKGQVGGEAPSVLRVALKSLGIKRVVWLHADFGELIHELESGRIDVIAAGMFITPERARRLLFSRPTVAVRTALLQRDDAVPLRDLADVAAHPSTRLAVIAGAVEADMARKAGVAAAQIQGFPDAITAVAAVRNHSADAFALSSPSLHAFLRGAGDDGNGLVVVTSSALQTTGFPAFAFRLGDAALHDRIDAALAGYLGSPAHFALEAGFGFGVADVELARDYARKTGSARR